jgi:KaiC/GvpD/RAD55 family RecA-like ATPase
VVSDFFQGFAGHAHTKNEIIIDPNSEIELRKTNNPEEAQRLTEKVLDKLEKDISSTGYDLKDVKLLILYLSYRGENKEKDHLIIERILRVIEERFTGRMAPNQLRLIGNTTAGEIENEDLVLKEVSGIGYNGLSLLALVTNLPIGIGRTWGTKSETESVEQGREMVHDAWVDLNQRIESKGHIQKSKTLFVLASTGKNKFWQNHFLMEGIASFMRSTHESRIANVMGGLGGDGLIGRFIYQFYGKIGKKSELKILEGESICTLIPNLSEPSIGLDTAPTHRIGKSHVFHFDPKTKPQFMYVKRIDNKDPREIYAKIIYENEARISHEKGLLILNKEELLKIISEFEPLPFHPILGKYAFAFPFGNYAPAEPIGMRGQNLVLERPIRCYEPRMAGYIVQTDCKKVQKGTRNVYNMLRENRGFTERDVTLFFVCILRRVAEIMAGCTSKTEAKILKETFSSTQVMGFLAYGEFSFTHLLQEPYVWTRSCWGITLRSLGESRITLGKVLPDRITTGVAELDGLLLGGIPENYNIILTGPPSDERDQLIKCFLESGAREGQITFHITHEGSSLKRLAKKFQSNFYIFLNKSKTDSITKDLPNVYRLKGRNLTNLGIALIKALRSLKQKIKEPKRVCIEIVSDVLLHEKITVTTRWLSELLLDFKSKNFTTLAVMDPLMHPPNEVHAVLNLFDGEISIFETEDPLEFKKSLRIKKLRNQEYIKKPICLKEQTSI